MYHIILKDRAKEGYYTITPETFREDMLYLLECGYSTVFMSEVIDHVFNGTDLPEKPVVITFDDAYYNVYLYVLPILQELGLKACISAVGEYTDRFTQNGDKNPNYAYMTWDDLKAAQQSGYFEVLSHSFNMHDRYPRQGMKPLPGEDTATYKRAITHDILRMQELIRINVEVTPQTFVYPFGHNCESSEEVLKSLGYLATLSCWEKISHINDPDDLFLLGRFNRPGGTYTYQFMNKAGIK